MAHTLGKRLSGLTGLLALLLVTACGGGGGIGEPGLPTAPGAGTPDDDPLPIGQVLRDDVLTLTAEDFVTYESHGDVYRFASPSSVLRGVTPGDVLLHAAPPGFLRRVVSVLAEDAYAVEVLTVQATMTEAFREADSGALRAVGDEEIDLEDGVSLKTLGADARVGAQLRVDEEKTLYFPQATFDLRKDLLRTANAQITLDGTLTITPSFYLQLYVDDYDGRTKLRSAELKGSLHATGEFEALATVSGSLTTDPVRLFKRSKWFTAGPHVFGRVILTAHAYTEAALQGHARAHADLEGELAIGARYEIGDGWSPIRTSDLTFTTEIDAGIAGSLKPKVDFEFTVEFYGVADTGLTVTPYLELQGAASTQTSLFEWDLSGGIEGGIHLALGILDWDLARWDSPTITFFRQSILSGSYPLYYERVSAPSALTASADSSGIHLAWKDRSSNETGFELRRRASGASAWSLVGQLAADTTGVTDTASLSAGTIYQYRVRATGKDTDSEYSNTTSCQAQSLDDYGDTRSDAERMYGTGKVSGSIEDAGDVDMFLFVPSSTATYTLRTYGTTDTELRLYTASGTQLAFNDDATKSDSNARIDRSLAKNTSYYVAVSGYRQTARGAYVFEIGGGGSSSSGSAPTLRSSKPTDTAPSLQLTSSTVSQEFVVSVTDPDGDASSVVWAVDGTQSGSATSVSNGSSGTASKTLTFNTTGTFLVTAQASDQGGRTSSTIGWKVTVWKATATKKTTTCTISLADDDVVVGTSVFATVTLTRSGTASYAGGKVSFSVDGKQIGLKSPTNDKATFLITTDTAGTRNLKATFSGDANYQDSSDTDTLTVSKKTPKLIAGAVPNTLNVGDTTTIIGIIEIDGKAASGKTLKLYVDGTLVTTGTSIADGSVYKQNYKVTSSGTHTVKVDFAGDAKTASATKTATFKASKRAVSVSVGLNKTTLDYGKTVRITGTITSSGKAVANKLLKVTASGSLLMTKLSDTSGKVVYDYTPTTRKNYTIKVEYAGDTEYESDSDTASLTVGKGDTIMTMTLSKNPVELGQISYCTVKLLWETASGDKALSGRSVNFTVGTKSLGPYQTKSDGTYTLGVQKTTLSYVAIEAKYAGETDYSSSSKKQTLGVWDTTAPGVVTHIAPSNNSTGTSSTVKCAWKAGFDWDPTLVYSVYLEKYGTGYSPYRKATSTSLAYYFTSLPKGSYRWRVTAADTSGNVSKYSGFWYFTVK